MTSKTTTEKIIESFSRASYPEPYEFTDREITAISAIAGIDAEGSFANGSLEQSLILRYSLEAKYGEHTWPGFAENLREQKSLHFSRFSSVEKEHALNWLNEAIATCVCLGISAEQIGEQLTGL